MLWANEDFDGFDTARDAFVGVYGAPVGSRVCDEGQIFIEPQGMCVMAGIGRAPRQGRNNGGSACDDGVKVS